MSQLSSWAEAVDAAQDFVKEQHAAGKYTRQQHARCQVGLTVVDRAIGQPEGGEHVTGDEARHILEQIFAGNPPHLPVRHEQEFARRLGVLAQQSGFPGRGFRIG